MVTLGGTAGDYGPAPEMSGSFPHWDTQFKCTGLKDFLVFTKALISKIEMCKILVSPAKFFLGNPGKAVAKKQKTKKSRTGAQ